MEDSAAALAILYALARSSASLGELDAARSYFLQAAALPDNVAPDKTYAELASMYVYHAKSMEGAPKRNALNKAIEALKLASDSPSASRIEADEYTRRLSALRQELNESAPAGETQDDAAGVPSQIEALPGGSPSATGDAAVSGEMTG
jgi:hypothetical protein